MVSSIPTQAESPKRKSNDPISWYLQNIGRVPLLTPAEEIELGNQVQKMMVLTEDGQLNEKTQEFILNKYFGNGLWNWAQHPFNSLGIYNKTH